MISRPYKAYATYRSYNGMGISPQWLKCEEKLLNTSKYSVLKKYKNSNSSPPTDAHKILAGKLLLEIVKCESDLYNAEKKLVGVTPSCTKQCADRYPGRTPRMSNGVCYCDKKTTTVEEDTTEEKESKGFDDLLAEFDLDGKTVLMVGAGLVVLALILKS